MGAGTSLLVDLLLAASFTDVTILDVSERALEVVRERLGERATGVTLIHADLLTWAPQRRFDVWHDRAVFHFLTTADERARYVRLAESSVPPGGALVVATFAPDGPTQCSGLPVRRYDAAGLTAEFGVGFDLIHSEREEHLTPSGAVQPFTWVLLRRVTSAEPDRGSLWPS